MEEKCEMCDGLGRKGGCFVCGKEPTEVFIPPTELESDELCIPKYYRGVKFDPKVLLMDLGDDAKNYVEELDALANTFKNAVPGQSAIISSLPKSGKTTLVYTCLQYAKMYTDGISQYITLLQARQDMEKGEYKYVDKEVLFVRVPEIYNRWSSEDIIRELLVYRSLKDLATFIISDFPIKEILPVKLHRVLDSRKNVDPLKYPVYIPYFPSV